MARSSLSIAFVGALIIATSFLLISFGIARANPTDFTTVKSAAATTSPTYVTPGVATSTLVYDVFNGGSAGESNAADSAVFLLQTAASSTSSVFTVSFAYSQDGVDYYQDQLTATTTTMNVAVPQTYSFTAAGTATTSRAFTLPVPTRFVKATVSVSGANGAVWSSIVSKKQQP